MSREVILHAQEIYTRFPLLAQLNVITEFLAHRERLLSQMDYLPPFLYDLIASASPDRIPSIVLPVERWAVIMDRNLAVGLTQENVVKRALRPFWATVDNQERYIRGVVDAEPMREAVEAAGHVNQGYIRLVREKYGRLSRGRTLFRRGAYSVAKYSATLGGAPFTREGYGQWFLRQIEFTVPGVVQLTHKLHAVCEYTEQAFKGHFYDMRSPKKRQFIQASPALRPQWPFIPHLFPVLADLFSMATLMPRLDEPRVIMPAPATAPVSALPPGFEHIPTPDPPLSPLLGPGRVPARTRPLPPMPPLMQFGPPVVDLASREFLLGPPRPPAVPSIPVTLRRKKKQATATTTTATTTAQPFAIPALPPRFTEAQLQDLQAAAMELREPRLPSLPSQPPPAPPTNILPPASPPPMYPKRKHFGDRPRFTPPTQRLATPAQRLSPEADAAYPAVGWAPEYVAAPSPGLGPHVVLREYELEDDLPGVPDHSPVSPLVLPPRSRGRGRRILEDTVPVEGGAPRSREEQRDEDYDPNEDDSLESPRGRGRGRLGRGRGRGRGHGRGRSRGRRPRGYADDDSESSIGASIRDSHLFAPACEACATAPGVGECSRCEAALCDACFALHHA